VTFYTGLIPMLATAGNTTDDGFVGAIVNDRFADRDEEDAADPSERASPISIRIRRPFASLASSRPPPGCGW
jgi:hypothetical protein